MLNEITGVFSSIGLVPIVIFMGITIPLAIFCCIGGDSREYEK